MAVTTIPNVTNWSVTPQNGQVGYFTLMNTWLSESTAVLASLQTAINAQNTANSEINALAIQVADKEVVKNLLFIVLLLITPSNIVFLFVPYLYSQ